MTPLETKLAEALRCLQAAVVGEINGIPNDLKEQLTRTSKALAEYDAQKAAESKCRNCGTPERAVNLCPRCNDL